MSKFEIDSRLENDTILIASLECCDLRLMNDQRWPWLVLVPRIDGAVELHELKVDLRAVIDSEATLAASILKQLTNAEKINIATLGNIVRQLHIHVIARNTGDPNWPGPVWGFGERQPYPSQEQNRMIEQVGLALDLAGYRNGY